MLVGDHLFLVMTGAHCFSYGWLGILGPYSAAGTFWGLAHLGWG